MSALPLKLGLLLVEYVANLIYQSGSFGLVDCLLGTGLAVMVSVLVAVLHHCTMVRPALIPNLVHEVLFFEHLEQVVLLTCVHEVQPLLESVVPLVIRG